MLTIQVIYTFETLPQEFYTIELDRDNSIELEFIGAVLCALDEERLRQLVKLSCCQMYCERDEDLRPFLAARSGKYYFNPAVNRDANGALGAPVAADTLAWSNIRDWFAATRFRRLGHVLACVKLLLTAYRCYLHGTQAQLPLTAELCGATLSAENVATCAYATAFYNEFDEIAEDILEICPIVAAPAVDAAMRSMIQEARAIKSALDSKVICSVDNIAAQYEALIRVMAPLLRAEFGSRAAADAGLGKGLSVVVAGEATRDTKVPPQEFLRQIARVVSLMEV